MENDNLQNISPIKIRLSFLLILIWWLPFWALAPYLANLINIGTATATFIIMAIQTLIGAIGLMIIGKQAAGSFKKLGFRASIKTIWHALIHGTI